MNQELLDYIKQAKESGLDDAQIRQSLLEQGWSDSDIDEVINKKDKRFSDKKKRPWIIPAIAVFVVLILAIGGLVYYFYFQDQPATQETVSCDLEQKEGNIIVRGKVVFPTGIRDKETYEVIGTNPESFSINSDGVFCAYAAQGRPILVSAVSDDENDFVLAAIVNSNGDISDFIINSKSTAVTLVFLNPLINPELLVDTIPNNPDVIKFADKINSLSDLTINDFEEGGRLYEDYDNAVISVLESVTVDNTTEDRFTAIILNGAYSDKQIIGEKTAIEPVSLESELNRAFILSEETNFINTPKPISSELIPFNKIYVTGYYDARKSKVFIEIVELK